MKTPKTLYEYEHHQLTKVKIKLGASLERVVVEPWGTRWRYRGEGFDQYGWDSQKAAKQAAIRSAQRTIFHEREFLRKLGASE